MKKTKSENGTITSEIVKYIAKEEKNKLAELITPKRKYTERLQNRHHTTNIQNKKCYLAKSKKKW